MEVYAYSACFILALLAIFQIALIAGTPLGHYAWGGKYDVLPLKMRIGSTVSIVIYIVIAMIILANVGIIPTSISDTILETGLWVLVVYFSLGIAMNGVSRSIRERVVMTPVALILALLCLLMALR